LFDAPPCDLLLTTTAGAEVHGLAR
jgi:hypothetical protein